MLFLPLFPGISCFGRTHAGAKLIINRLPSDQFDIDFDALERSLDSSNKKQSFGLPEIAFRRCYPRKQVLIRLCAVLKQKEQQHGHPIFLISDEPVRTGNLVYDDIEVPYLMNYYDNTIVCYSIQQNAFSAGRTDRYIAICVRCTQEQDLYVAICGAGPGTGLCLRTEAYFNGLPQTASAHTSDSSAYRKNRDLLYQSLCQYGIPLHSPGRSILPFCARP